MSGEVTTLLLRIRELALSGEGPTFDLILNAATRALIEHRASAVRLSSFELSELGELIPRLDGVRDFLMTHTTLDGANVVERAIEILRSAEAAQ